MKNQNLITKLEKINEKIYKLTGQRVSFLEEIRRVKYTALKELFLKLKWELISDYTLVTKNMRFARELSALNESEEWVDGSDLMELFGDEPPFSHILNCKLLVGCENKLTGEIKCRIEGDSITIHNPKLEAVLPYLNVNKVALPEISLKLAEDDLRIKELLAKVRSCAEMKKKAKTAEKVACKVMYKIGVNLNSGPQCEVCWQGVLFGRATPHCWNYCDYDSCKLPLDASQKKLLKEQRKNGSSKKTVVVNF